MEKVRRNPLAAVSIVRSDNSNTTERVNRKVSYGDGHRLTQMLQKSNFDTTDQLYNKVHTRKSDEKRRNNRFSWRKAIPYETIILENTIVKILGLLALGFGEAGAGIIAKNIEDSHGGLNAIVEGRKITAIFGFCDIRQFTDATEILKEKVMVFVNKIADIVHGTVDQFSGAANKNIGDAFLVVWKFPEIEIGYGKKEQVTDLPTLSVMADMSVVAFLKIIARINRSPILDEYQQQNLELFQQFSPDFRVRMGFGLHVGWAIEGAIGSRFKIDASYLSPNVNIASRLEAATKQYGIYLLLSEAIYDLLTPPTQSYCRQIDRVTVKGSKLPMAIYTIDVEPSNLKTSAHTNMNFFTYIQSNDYVKHQQLQMWSSQFNVSMLFESDKDIIEMRSHLKDAFFWNFSKGYCHYQAGQWKIAQYYLSKTQYYGGKEDGPSTTLLEYMMGYNFVAPASWPGYRRLTEK